MLAVRRPGRWHRWIDRALPVTNFRRWPRGDFAFSRDGRRLAAPTRRDRTVVGVWDVALGRPVATLRGSGGPVTAVAFGPDGRSLASAAAGGPNGRPIVTLWHLASGRPIRTFEAGPDPVEALAFSGDGRRLAAGGGTTGGPGWVTAWDAETGAVLGTLDRVGLVKSLAFHPDGVRLAVADYGETKVHLWDLAAGTLITHPGPNGRQLRRRSPRTGSGWRRWATTATSTSPTPGPATRCWCSAASARPPARRLHAPAGLQPRRLPDRRQRIDRVLNLWDLGPASGLAVEPEAGDLAGWLRRSRALAERGDAAAAEAACARARDITGRDASPWIEHAVSLYRRGDSARARDALARAMEALPDDPGRWIDLGRLLGRLGWTEESATVLAKARSLCERRLARAPDDEAAAAALAELLPEADASAGWTVLRPDVMTSAAGATLTRLPDGSVLAGGPNPAVDTYTIEATTGLSGITGLRLEAIPDPSLPRHGPGRDPDSGNFHLDVDPPEHRRRAVGPGPGPPVPGPRRLFGTDVRAPGRRAVPSTRTRPPPGRSGRWWADLIGPSSRPPDRSGRVPARGCGWSWPAGREYAA